MKQKEKFMTYLAAIFLACVVMAPSLSHAATMTDYCASPPFIARPIEPNLLLLIDNSASMFDLEYVDKGSTTPARNPYYCYDETFSTANSYMGYFDSSKYYKHDGINSFVEISSADFSALTCANTTKSISGLLYVCYNAALLPNNGVTVFAAKGNYLNWLTASKFDVEKMILTGGQYCTGNCAVSNTTCCSSASDCPLSGTCNPITSTANYYLKAESRGCVGRGFTKGPLTADFVPYAGTSTDPNTSLGITFDITSPANPLNASAISSGGQTYLNVYQGAYDKVKCQAAIDLLVDPNAQKQATIDAIDACLNANTSNYCQLDPSTTCTTDANCLISPSPLPAGICGVVSGTCAVTTSGTCGVSVAGTCGVSSPGTCTANNGTCSANNNKKCIGGTNAGANCSNKNDCNSGVCATACIGGAKAGAQCTNDASCAFSSCSAPASKAGAICSVNSDCDIKGCTAGKPNGTACVFNSDCNIAGCTAGKPNGTACTVNTDCNVATCTAGKPAGTACTVNTDCDLAGACASGPFTGLACTDDWSCSTNKGHCITPSTSKSLFSKSMHQCYQYTKKGQDFGQNDLNWVEGVQGCAGFYSTIKTCSGGSMDGYSCSVAGDCPGGSCQGGPNSIRPGSPLLMCSDNYVGACATTTDNWATVSWISDSCVYAQLVKFCGDNEVPPVVDPTEPPSATSSFENLPAIIIDMGVQNQLTKLGTLPVNVNVPLVSPPGTGPTGVIQQFNGVIRMGAMSFDYNGTPTECGKYVCSSDLSTACVTLNATCSVSGVDGRCIDYLPCPKKCSVTTSTVCTSTADCPFGETCIATVKNTDNLDGAKVLHNVDISVGDHFSGLVREIDKINANAWTPFSEGFYNAIGYYALTSTTVTPMRLNPGDFNLTPVPSQAKCQKNNVLMITDGQSTADLNSTVSTLLSTNSTLLPSGAHYDTAANNSCVSYAGSRNIESLAWLAQHRNIQDIATQTPSQNNQKVATYVVYSGTGSLDSSTCANPSTNLATLDDCQPDNMMCKTARYGGGTYYLAQDPAALTASLKSAFTEISTAAASGTAASVLASGEGSGANLVQAIFYPAREVGAYEVDWTGRLQNFWYFIDPRLGNSTIMEDTDLDKALKLSKDNTVAFVYDPVAHQTTVTTKSPGGVVTPNVSLEDVHYLWEAGKLLLGRTAGTVNGATPGTGARRIFTNTRVRGVCSSTGTNCGATSDCMSNESCVIADHTIDAFDITNDTALQPLLNVSNVANADNLIKYIRGTDDLNGNGVPSLGNPASSPIQYLTDSGDTIDGVQVRNRTLTQGTVTDVWKLGDIVNSTPKILSWVPVNSYYEIYSDDTYKTFTGTTDYKSRGMVFAGANDGMMHAFKLGLLGLYDNADLKATLGTHCSTKVSQACECPNDPPTYPCSSGMTPACPGSETCVKDSDLGQELWAFIPKNSLPYLKYTADPNYCHLYFIDAQPFIFDASFTIDAAFNPPISPSPAPEDTCDAAHYWNCKKNENSWNTVLIGSMRLGGACRNTGSSCQDCTKTPINNVGYSSYFALDVTDPLNPKLLWEFSDRNLGFSVSGPAIVRVANPNLDKKNKNGRWLAVFGSGPTGWISKNNNMAISSMYLSNVGTWNSRPNYMKLFVVDVATGQLVTTIDTGELGAFAGSLLNATMDFDQNDLSKPGNYQDDAVYFGYTKGYVYGADSFITMGDALGGTANTMKLNNVASTTNDFYKGNFIEMWQQDASFEWHYEGVKLITGYDGATQTVTVDSNFPVVPTAGWPQPSTFYNITKGWTRGGVKRLLTKQDIDPTHWAVSTVINSASLSGNASYNSSVDGAGMGPVTASVKKLQNFSDNSLRLYFGTGRYFYRMSELLDDPSNRRAIFGIKEPCFQSTGSTDPLCTTLTSGNIAGGAPAVSNIGDAASRNGAVDPTLDGWWITLDGCRDSTLASVDCVTASGVDNPVAVFKAERVVTDPLAATNGGVFFSTITPTSDPCEYGGRSYLWGVRYDTGGTLVGTGILKGKAIIQRSTGDIEQLDLATVFTTAFGGQAEEKKTSASFGLTGTGGMAFVVPPQPINRILHIQKR